MSNSYETILVERRGGVAIVTINRPEKRNALNIQTRAEGAAILAPYDALWASRDQPDATRDGGLPPVPAPEIRLARVRTLTHWNDRAERTQEEVLAVVDRAISATIMDLMSALRPPAQPARR